MKRISAILLALVMLVTAIPYYPASVVEASGTTDSTGGTTENVLFEDDFDEGYSEKDYSDWLAKEIFGEGNYALESTLLSIDNGGLRITVEDSAAQSAQMLLASDEAIQESGVVIECDYTLNKSDYTGRYFAFASKPVVDIADVLTNDVWLAGIWGTSGYRVSLRGKGNSNAWNKPGVASLDATYSTQETVYNLRLEVTPNDGILLSAKKASETTYTELAHVTTEQMDAYTTVNFDTFRDGNVRLVAQRGSDTTIDNLKLYAGTQATVDATQRTYLVNNDFASYPEYEEWLADRIFGEGNHALASTMLSIENGGLRIKVDADAPQSAQMLLASNDAIKDSGIVIECDYTLNTNTLTDRYFAFASKPLVESGDVLKADVWLAGIWGNGYRASLRGAVNNAWNKPGVASSDATYSTQETVYNLRLEVTPDDGILLSAKKASETTYTELAHVTTNQMDDYSTVDFDTFRDGNVRLVAQNGSDTTIDNLKVTVVGTSSDDNTGGGDNTGGDSTGEDVTLPEGVYFENNFDAENIANLQNDALAEAVFGKDNYLLGKDGNNATVSIENGGLRIKSSESVASQYLLATDDAIKEYGAVIECDYVFNAGSNGQFVFASKPLETSNYIDSNNIWITGIWAKGYRASLRGKANNYGWENPGIANTKDTTYSTQGTTFNLKVEVTPEDGIRLSVKRPTEEEYKTLANLTLADMALVPEVSFTDYRDGNVRLIVAANCDVTIDNLKVSIPQEDKVEIPKKELPAGVYFDDDFSTAEYAQLKDDDLAEAVFGKGNYLLGKNGNNATVSIENGGLRIKSSSSAQSQYLLASDDAIKEYGAVIECDYVFNAGSNGQFVFASKPLETSNYVDSNNVWITGIWAKGYRASLRGKANGYAWENPGIANTKDTTYSTQGTTFNLKVEVTPEDGIRLSVKRSTEAEYKTLVNLTLADMALVPEVSFTDYRDGNVRLIVAANCDVTIDNLKVSVPKDDKVEIPKKELPAGVYFDDDFSTAEYAQLKDDDLAEAVFGKGGYLLGKNGNNATVSIENGGLRIKSSESVASQYLLATDDAIKERGAVIECDYVLNTGSNGQFAFASKPLERGNLIDSNDVWITGIWAKGYRASLRGKANNYGWEAPGLANTKDPTYSTTGTAYKLRIEVTPNGGIQLFAKKASESDYHALLTLSTDKMALVPEVSFSDYRDGNVRLIVAKNCDVTIDNLKVVLGPEVEQEIVVEKAPLEDGVLFYDDFSNSKYADLSDSDLAKAIFGEGNYLLGQGSTPAMLSIQNGALRIIGDDNGTPTNGETPINYTQFLLASDERVSQYGVVIECDYTFNTLTDGVDNRAMLFGGKTIATRNPVADSWFSGPYANAKSRTAIRHAPTQEWKPLVYGGNVESSGLLGVNYKLRMEVSPSNGVALYAKRNGMDDYVRLGKWSKEDLALFKGDYKDCFDENIRMLIQCNMDVTIDNLRVSLMNYSSKMKVSDKDMYFFDDFNDETYTNLENENLAEAIFGKYNFLLGHGTKDATMKIENGALRLVGDDNTDPTDGTAKINTSQFLLASHPNIEKEGVIIECDYIFNAGAINAFLFSSKGLATSTDPKKSPNVMTNLWLSGPYANAKARTAVRYEPKQAWSPLVYGASADTSGETEVRYHLKLEVSPTEGLALYVKTSMKGEYRRLGQWTEDDIRLFTQDYKDCLDENVRLILQTGCDVTIDNLAVYAPGTDYVATEEVAKVKVNGKEMELPLGACDLSTLVDGEFLFAVVDGKVVLDPMITITHDTKIIEIYSLSLNTLDGVAARTDKIAALRWLTTVDQDEYNALQAAVEEGVIKDFEVGTIIMPTTALQKSGVLNLDQKENGADIQVFEDEWISESAYEGMYLYSGVKDDIGKEDYNTRYCGVGYAMVTLKNGKKLNVYGNFDRYVHSRTISEVATAALQDDNNGLKEKQERRIKKFAKAFVGKDAIDGAMIDIALIENGASDYSIAVAKEASDTETKFANQLRTTIASQTGVALKMTKDTRYKEEAYEIVIGGTNYKESQELTSNLDINEYSVRVVGNKILIHGITDSTLEEAVNMFSEKFKSSNNAKDKGGTKSLTFTIADETRDEMSNWLADIPEFKGGTYEAMYECGNDSIQLYYSNVDSSRIDAYVEQLQKLGYELKEENMIGNNRYVTCVGEKGMVHLTYLNYFETMTIVTDPLVHEIYKETEPEYEKITDTTLAVMSLDYSHRSEQDGNGESYVITLEDGRYIIIDGGYSYDADGLYNFLVDNNKRKDGKVVVAAWIISHSHGDHYGAFGEFAGVYGDKIKVEYVVASPGAENMYSNGYDSWMTDNLPSYIEAYDAQLIRPHTGQVLTFCDVEFEILYTCENYAPNLITSENNASLVFRMTSEGQTVLFNNDAEYRVAELMANIYGDSLKSDMMQVNHHGRSGSYDLYFSYVNPQYTLWTTNHITFDLRTAGVFNSSTDNETTLKGNMYLYNLVGRDNCFVADGDVEIIKFPLTDKTTDITYYKPDLEARK